MPLFHRPIGQEFYCRVIQRKFLDVWFRCHRPSKFCLWHHVLVVYICCEKWASSLESWRVVTCCSVRKIPIAVTACRWQAQTSSVGEKQLLDLCTVATNEAGSNEGRGIHVIALYSVVVVATTVKSVHTTMSPWTSYTRSWHLFSQTAINCSSTTASSVTRPRLWPHGFECDQLKFNLLYWSPNSTDLNPIEHL